MAPNGGSSFGKFSSFLKEKDKAPFKLTPITTEFSKGSVPDSLSTINRESAWSRWRRGYELATATFYDNDYTYPFKYQIPTPSGSVPSGNLPPTISGTFVGFPTSNKELGMHWAVWRYAGSLKCDQLTDPVSGQRLSIASVTEDANYWYVKLTGTWSASNPLPPPFYIPVSGQPSGLKPANTEIFEDRIITPNGPIITKDTINPTNQKRYGYVQAIVVDIDPFTGILKFKKDGSVEVTPDAVFVTPASKPFEVGRFLITGSRYCCTCQDFTHRDYSFLATNGEGNKKQFPRSSVASIKPGRFDVTTVSGQVNNNAMTPASVDRTMEVYAPSGYELDYTVTDSSNVDLRATRDNPGVYREFGATYIRSTTDIALPGSIPEGIPTYSDYSSVPNPSLLQSDITSVTDVWTPLLDELRYCKHIYALKFKDEVFPPEPSDFPVQVGSMAAWEQKLVEDTENDQKEARAFRMTKNSLAKMDVPPYNCQSPMMFSMIQKLLNITTRDVFISNFTMFDKDGNPYSP
jgi:hypothetical protein